MTYAVLRSLAQTILRFLNSDQYPLSGNGKLHLVSLHQKVNLLREYLEQFPRESKCLERRIREAANEAEDVIEHFMYEHIRSRAGGRATDIQYDSGELELVMAEIVSIAQEIGTVIIQQANQREPSLSPVPTPPAVESVTVGLDQELEKIKDLILENRLNQKIIPITGMGGIGKTTLAYKVYNHPSIISMFDVCAWVTVSEDYNLENIFAHLFDSLQKVVESDEKKSNYSYAHKVYKILWKRKYLIVLDDLWSEDAWVQITQPFPRNYNGSRIVITTRNEYTGSIRAEPHRMHLMDPGESWKLLKQKVFPNKECPPALEKVGKDIAKGCLGLPLATVVIAGILSTISATPSSWKEVAENVRSLIHKDAQFQKRMYLSYTHLPHHLRPCLLYLSGFPGDCEIRVSTLTKLWIAEGFIEAEKDKSLEEEAEKYLENIVGRNLALVTRNKSNGKIKGCSLHDFVQDLCKTIAVDENFERRVSNAHPDLRCLAKAYASTLRSVVCFQPTKSSLLGMKKLRLLRVLDVVDTHAYSLPPKVFDLYHLRYLAFGCRMEIPPAISRLQNLRTLIIRPSKGMWLHSKDEVYLPIEIWSMPLLEHLVSFFDLLPDPEGAASALNNLLTLSVVKRFICTKVMMAMIPNLKKLAITYFGDKIKCRDDYKLNNLVFLHQLEKLTLVLKKGAVVDLKKKPVFPEKLRKLTLSGWRFPWDDMDAVGSLPNLEVLKLRDYACQGDTWETAEWQFPQLKFLLIEDSDLEKWETAKADFPELKHLVLHGCANLKEIPEEIGEIATLEKIDVGDANKPLRECVQRIVIKQAKYNKILLV